jgi:hypothetical protein
VQHEQRIYDHSISAHPDCAAHDALQNRDRTKLWRFSQSKLVAVPDSAAHRFALSAPAVVAPLVYALALRRIRDTRAVKLAQTA